MKIVYLCSLSPWDEINMILPFRHFPCDSHILLGTHSLFQI